MAKLDRVMKALSASFVPYSQGINSMVVVLLSFFEEEIVFWIIRRLIVKTQNILNDGAVYEKFMTDLE